MTSRTRGRLMICLILSLIALPVETLILPVAMTPDPMAAAQQYSAGLSNAELTQAAAEIDAYPANYRRAIMQQLPSEQRANVWRTQFQNYLSSHRDLSASQADAVRDAMAVVSADLFTASQSAEQRDRVSRVFNKAVSELGSRAAMELFVTLGPRELTRASALPLRQQLADRVRSWRVASAQSGMPDCNCNMTLDTCDLVPDPWLTCSQIYDCAVDTSWPMCGPFWSWACNGWCRITRMPGGEGGSGR